MNNNDPVIKVNLESHKTIQKIIENYVSFEISIVSQLKLETPNHHLTTGTNREEVWRTLFERIIPRKFCIEQGVFIIDSDGNISAEVDLAIFDESYTPYIFNFGKIKFIPIEAVAVAIQCKSNNYHGVKNWVKSIKTLRTKLNSVVRTQTKVVISDIDTQPITQTATRPILILCGLKSPSRNNQRDFDIVLHADFMKGKLIKTIRHSEDTLSMWLNELNHFAHIRYGDEQIKYEKLIKKNEPVTERKLNDLRVPIEPEKPENVTLSLTFQLNQLLMLINNPIFFPHKSYSNMFSQYLSQEQGGKHE